MTKRPQTLKSVLTAALIAAALTGSATGPAAAEQLAQAAFPVKGKPITIIVPYAGGGVTDTGARLMAAGLEKELGTPVQVVNKVGAASQLGLTELVRAAPDGYTLSYAVLPTVVTHYFDPARGAIYTRANFQPVAMHHYVPQVLAVRTESPWKTVKDLVDAARAAPETIKISDSGLMAVPHTQVLMLQAVAGVKFASVHFGGGAPSVTALLGGHVDVLSGSTADALAHYKSGAFRVLGISAEKPDASMPEIPTMKSQGFDVLAASATGIVAPARLPAPVLQTLTAAMKKVIDSPEHRQRLTDLALAPYYLDPQQYADFWVETEKRVIPVLKSIQQ
jgi:tripartite-type tricarboxylate transporter receptor subunit TctC